MVAKLCERFMCFCYMYLLMDIGNLSVSVRAEAEAALLYVQCDFNAKGPRWNNASRDECECDELVENLTVF